MTILFTCSNIKKAFKEIDILKGINLTVCTGERIGLVGLNGCGKTTLTNIIFGMMEASDGRVNWHKTKTKMCYLQQSTDFTCCLSDVGIEGTGFRGYSEGKDAIGIFLKTANQLGLDDCIMENAIVSKESHNLSGGEKIKLELAKIWAMRPEFIILDEPTNHLDYKGVKWITEELAKFKGTILIVSHDRYFLDNNVNRILEIEDGYINDYKGNYSFYRDEKKRRYESQLNQYLIQERYKQKIEGYINRLEEWSDKAHRESTKAPAGGVKLGAKEKARAKAKKMDIQIKSRIKRLKKIEVEGVKKPKEEQRVDFKLNDANKKGYRIITADNLSKGFGNKVLFSSSSFYINRGEKVALIGDNGCGKTTLLKIILGEEAADRGKVFISSSCKVGFLSQTSEEKKMDVSIADFLEIHADERGDKAQQLLANMGFKNELLNKSLSSLSFGEITRLKIIRLILKGSDLLILDEPLNHLDLHSREKLEEGLESYEGTVIIVSHDRYMLERICSKLLVFSNKRVYRKEYGLEEYFERQNNIKERGATGSSFRSSMEEKLILETKVAYILGKINNCTVGTPEYEILNNEYFKLMKKRKEIE